MGSPDSFGKANVPYRAPIPGRFYLQPEDGMIRLIADNSWVVVATGETRTGELPPMPETWRRAE